MCAASNTFPKVKLTQQDFISTIPWGIRGDRVRILQQEVENELLDAETLAAMAVMLGSDTFSDRIEEAWKLLLNSQNHDVHVCLADETGIDWCNEAKAVAAAVKKEAGRYIATYAGGDVTINTLSWNRPSCCAEASVPAFGYAAKAKADSKYVTSPWAGWFKACGYSARLLKDGAIELKIGDDAEKTALLGNLSVYMNEKNLDSRDAAPMQKKAEISADGKRAYAVLEGSLGGIAYIHRIVLTEHSIDFTTEFDFGDGAYFGPDISEFQIEPRRTHYFQHERKLCMNWKLAQKNAELLYVSPFLTWPADGAARSIESLHYVALQGENYGLAHMNVGQSGYGHQQEASACEHALSFAPHDYIYGKPEKLILKGRHEHHYRFFPYQGDWRDAELPLKSSEYQRPLLRVDSDSVKPVLSASLLQVKANSTIASALFERSGKVYLRIWEWAGQKDDVELVYGDASSTFNECTHGLKPIGAPKKSFSMRPWEIKTIQVFDKALPLAPYAASAPSTFAALPSGWDVKSQFTCEGACAGAPVDSGVLYFASGYHDGFVKPLEHHSETMAIEMERTKKYEGYTNTWEVGGSCWVRLGINEPEYLEELKKHLQDGSIEIAGGTWCEPFGLIVSGESNIRQMLYGLEAIKENLDYDVRIYSNQEHGTYAQMPQILRSFGLRAAVNRTQWAPYGYESAIDAEIVDWEGPDGTRMWLIPRYHSMDYKNCPWDDRNLQNGSVTGHNRVWRTEEKFAQMLQEALAHGIRYPLMTMLEDIWAKGLRTTDEEMDFYASLPNVRFISLARYLMMVGVPME